MSTTQSLPNLPPSAVRQALQAVTARLPLPVIDAPEERAARDEVIIAAAALGPANAFEAMLAVQVIAAHVHAMDCLRLAVQPNQQPEEVRRCRAHAIALLRQMQSALRTLQRMQAARGKVDAAARPAVHAPDEAPGSADITAEAEQYALHHRKRASLIRSLGRLPDRLDFGPLSPDLITAIVTGTSPILQALEGRPGQKDGAAA